MSLAQVVWAGRCHHGRPYPKEFRTTLCACAHREDGVTIERSPPTSGCTHDTVEWLRRPRSTTGRTGQTTVESCRTAGELRRRNGFAGAERGLRRAAGHICRSRICREKAFTPRDKSSPPTGIPSRDVGSLNLAASPLPLAWPPCDPTPSLAEAYSQLPVSTPIAMIRVSAYRVLVRRGEDAGHLWQSDRVAVCSTTAGGVCSASPSRQERQGRPTGP